MLRQALSGALSPLHLIVYLFSAVAVIFLTMPIHEFAHGWAAVKLGDNTPRWQGRLSLNPFAHIDWIGAACILLFGFGWARPVQVNHNNFRNPKRDMAITALAGPLSNLLVALISLVVFNLISLFYEATYSAVLMYLGYFVFYIANINISLAVFNLIPIPPLDGSRILSALLPYRYYYALMRYERIIFWALLALLWFGILDAPLSFLTNGAFSLLSFIAGLPFRLF